MLMRNETSFSRSLRVVRLVAVSLLALLGACDVAKQAVEDAIVPEQSARVVVGTPPPTPDGPAPAATPAAPVPAATPAPVAEPAPASAALVPDSGAPAPQ